VSVKQLWNHQGVKNGKIAEVMINELIEAKRKARGCSHLRRPKPLRKMRKERERGIRMRGGSARDEWAHLI